LSRTGTFQNGVYTRTDAQGRKHNKDSYEAIWEFYNHRPIEYPRPRYADVAVMDPQAHKARIRGQGVKVRHLGSFSEGFTTVQIVEAETGARLEFGNDRQPTILFLRRGALKGAERSYPEMTAFHIGAGERQSFAVEAPVELLEVNLPDLAHIEAGS
jgi:hypothetical protein